MTGNNLVNGCLWHGRVNGRVNGCNIAQAVQSLPSEPTHTTMNITCSKPLYILYVLYQLYQLYSMVYQGARKNISEQRNITNFGVKIFSPTLSAEGRA